jgi:thymidylate synthase
VPGLLEQCSREPGPKPTLDIAEKPLDDLTFDDIVLSGYEPDAGIRFAVAE